MSRLETKEQVWSPTKRRAFQDKVAMPYMSNAVTTGFQYMASDTTSGTGSDYDPEDDCFVVAWNRYDEPCAGEPGYNRQDALTKNAGFITNERFTEICGEPGLFDIEFIGRHFVGLPRHLWDKLPQFMDAMAAAGRPLVLKLHSCEIKWTTAQGPFTLENLESALVDELEKRVSDKPYGACPPCSFSVYCYWALCCPWNWSSDKGKAWVRKVWTRVADNMKCACGRDSDCPQWKHWMQNVRDATGQFRFNAKRMALLKEWNAFEMRIKPDGTPSWSYYQPHGFYNHPSQQLPMAVLESDTPQNEESAKSMHAALRMKPGSMV